MPRTLIAAVIYMIIMDCMVNMKYSYHVINDEDKMMLAINNIYVLKILLTDMSVFIIDTYKNL